MGFAVPNSKNMQTFANNEIYKRKVQINRNGKNFQTIAPNIGKKKLEKIDEKSAKNRQKIGKKSTKNGKNWKYVRFRIAYDIANCLQSEELSFPMCSLSKLTSTHTLIPVVFFGFS